MYTGVRYGEKGEKRKGNDSLFLLRPSSLCYESSLLSLFKKNYSTKSNIDSLGSFHHFARTLGCTSRRPLDSSITISASFPLCVVQVAFMGMLYLVYLVECYHSPIRIDLLHAESQDSVLSKLAQLKMAQPRIWWKAVSYHYVRRKRQITRYRNGDNYTTTQVTRRIAFYRICFPL